MVKGISKQVIVVNSPDKKLFDQAIFFLSEEAMASGGITDAALLKEARFLICDASNKRTRGFVHYFSFTSFGAAFVGMIWLLTVIL